MQLNQRVRTVAAKLIRTLRRLPITGLLLASAVAFNVPSTGVAAPPKADPAATIKQAMESRFPGAHVLDVQPSAMPGMYEIFMGDQIVYTDATGDYLLMGPLVDTQTRQNLTEARLNEHGKIDFSSLPFARAIKVVKGDGKRQFAVFSDPDCPFCQQLEKSLLSVNDVTMYVFLYPIPTLHPQAPAKAHAIWCAKDRAAAWTTWMHDKKLPPASTCAGDPLDELNKLADHLHINSTPTLFFANGRRVTGAISSADIEQALAASNAPKAATSPPK